MNKVIFARDSEQESAEEMLRALERYPVTMHADIREAYQAADAGDYEKAEGLCDKLLDYKADPEIRMLLGVCCFVQGKMQSARMVFSDLTEEYPEKEEYLRYLGMTDHALGRFEDAVRELQNLLYLDVVLGNGKYPQDVRLYYDFLDQTEMTETMQDYLAGNIVRFCYLMTNKGYRPLFLEFITHIRDRGYLTEEGPLETLASAFASWESCLFHEDRRVSLLMETYLNAGHERRYLALGEFTEEEKKHILIPMGTTGSFLRG